MNPPCKAVLMIKGEYFHCDWPTDPDGSHTGWAHANVPAEAIWLGPDEVPDSLLRNQPARDTRPHSRACGTTPHDHGTACHPNCQTCHGEWIPVDNTQHIT